MKIQHIFSMVLKLRPLKVILLVLGLCAGFGCAIIHPKDKDNAQKDQGPLEEINFQAVPPEQVLEIYHQCTGLELVTDSRVHMLRTTVTIQDANLPVSQLSKLMEQALREQAGIVITPLDNKHASVTYNDALPRTPAPAAPTKP